MRGGWLAAVLVFLVHPGVRAGESAIRVDAPARGCPGRAELVAELDARLPSLMRAGTAVERGYHLQVERVTDGDVRLQLQDGNATVVLERLLPGASSGEGCRALAQAAALVVVRYLREIGYRSATPPPLVEERREEPARPAPAAVSTPAIAPLDPAVPVNAAAVPATAPAGAEAPAVAERTSASVRLPAVAPVPSAGFLGAAGGARAGVGSGAADLRSELTVGMAATRGWIAGEIAGGVSSEAAVAVASAPDAQLRLRAFPLRAALGVPLSLAAGTLTPGAGINVDLLRFNASGLADARHGLRVEPAAELGLAYRAAGRRLFVRASVWGGLSLAPRDFDAGLAEPVFRTPAGYLRAQVETGLVLWKN